MALPKPSGRIEAIDLGRGIAVTLMILSHGTKGLLSFDQFPAWGLVPIHLLTKFSSSLFILIFGIALSAAYLPYADTPAWPAKRRKLLVRGLVVFFWYKVLTVVELFHLYSRQDIIDTLLYRAFPVYVEILDFYAIALLWVPLILPYWKRAPLWFKLSSPLLLGLLASLLSRNFGFWGIVPLKALLVEDKGHYTWGQLSRGPLILLGLLLGEWIALHYRSKRARILLVAALVIAASAALGDFASLNTSLQSIALNEGKHPPEVEFMLFSLGGAFLILAFALLGGERLARLFAPITMIGKDALQSFVFHIAVLFVFYRYLLGLWRTVAYTETLALTALLIALAAAWVKITRWVRQNS